MATPTTHHRSARLRSITTCCGGFVIAMGCLVLFGWIFNVESLRSVALGLTAMNPATALLLIIAGAALLALRDENMQRDRRAIGQTLAVVVIAMALIRLIGYGFGRDYGFVDQLLFPDKLDAYNPPNRIAPETAFSFALLGIAMLAIDWQTRRGRRPAQLVAVVIGLVAATAMVGYAYRALSLTQLQGHIRMALNTALAFVTLATGVLCARPNRGLMAVVTSDEPGGVMARRLLPAAILIPAALGYLLNTSTWMSTSLFVILIIVTLSSLIWISAASLNRADRKRHQAEDALLAERHLLHTLLDNLPDHIYFKDANSRFIRINRAQARTFQLADPNSVTGRTDRDFFTSEHAAQAELDERQVMLTGLPLIDEEEKETWADGRETWVATTKMPFRDPEGRVIGTFGISRDITLRKRAELALRASREQARLVVDTAHDAYVAMDGEGRIVEWNLQAETTFGWSRDEAIGKLVAETIIPPRYREAHSRGLKHFLATGEGPVLNRRIEIVAIDRNGREFPVELSITPLPIGSTYLFNAFVHDITNRKCAEEELQKAREAAEAANRAKSEFLANMSHEIRTPMNAVIGMTELVLDTKLDRLQREYLKMVQESAESLMTLINDILDFSKIEAGKLDLEAIPFSLRERLGDSIKLLAFRAHGKGLELACHVHPDVPDAVVGDPGRLRQIVVNLVGNAIKFTEQGEVVLSVERAVSGQQLAGSSQSGELSESTPATCHLPPATCNLHFTVRDTGIGIPSDKVRALFQAFEQVDASTTRKYGGTGLGLAISKRLVHLLGGEIWVESELGRGSKFHFTAPFPLAEHELAKAPLVEPTWDRDVSVLIVDDNATNRLILEETIRSWGMTSAAADSVHEALRILQEAHERQQPFGIVLADIHMPEVDGFTLVEWLRQDERFRETTVIVLTSGSQRGDLSRSKALRIAAHLMKPVKPSELFDAIGASMGSVVAVEDQIAVQPHQLRPLRVLLAEDSHVNQKLAVGLLGKFGHSITIANNGKEAVQLCNSQHFDAVLMDVQMPEMDGLEATAVIRAQELGTGRRIPIVAMTAGAMQGDREACLESGMDGYVAKPIRAQELFDTLDRVLRCEGTASAAPNPSADGQSVDIAAAIESIGGDPALFAEVARAFLDEGPKLMAAIADAMESGDAAKLVRPAHTLKGALISISANPAAELTKKLEQMARANDLPGTKQAIDDLQCNVRNVLASLETFLQQTVST